MTITKLTIFNKVLAFGSGYSCCCRNLEGAFISTQPHSPWRLQPSAHCLLLKCTSAALFSLTPTLLENASILLVPTGTVDLLFLVFFRRFVFLWSRERTFLIADSFISFFWLSFFSCVFLFWCVLHFFLRSDTIPKGLRSGDITPSSPTRPLSALSQVSTVSTTVASSSTSVSGYHVRARTAPAGGRK